jgi:integrase
MRPGNKYLARLAQLAVSDKTIQRILRHANVALTQSRYIKTADFEVAEAMQQFPRSLKRAPLGRHTAVDVIDPKENVR